MESVTLLKACAILVEVCYTMIIAVIPGSVLTETDDFIAINNSNSCVCDGYNLVYECSVTGDGAIGWKGTAFECPSSRNVIVLFQSSPNIHVCNEGTITGHIIRAENNTYVSQLTVSVSVKMIGMNISCFHDSGDTQNLIGSSLLTLTDPSPPPHDIYLMVASANRLVFKWSSVTTACEAVSYLINASNCGHCPNVINDTTVTCTGFSLDSQMCQLSVWTVVCGDNTGNESRYVEVALKVPDSPEINVIPTYSYNDKTLLRLTARFNETEAFNISDGVDGSTLSYTINYNSSNSGVTLCKTDKISATSCVNGICEYDDIVPPSACIVSYITPCLQKLELSRAHTPRAPSICNLLVLRRD